MPGWLRQGAPLLILLAGAMLLLFVWLSLAGSAGTPADPSDETLRTLRSSGPGMLAALLVLALCAAALIRLVYLHLLPEGQTPEARWGGGMFLFFSLLMLVFSVVIVNGYRGLTQVTPLPAPDPSNAMHMVALQGLVNAALVLGILLMARNAGPDGLQTLGLRWRSPLRTVAAVAQVLVLYVPIYFLTMLLGLLAYMALDREPAAQAVVQQAMALRGTPAFYVLAFFAVVVAPVTEELLYRGVLYPALRRPLPAIWAAGLCGLTFALVHWEPLALIPLFGLGTLLALLYERTGSLLAPIAAHAMFNAAQMAYMASS